MVKRYSETRFNSEGFDSPVNEIGVFENSHGEYVKFHDYDSREGELLSALREASDFMRTNCVGANRDLNRQRLDLADKYTVMVGSNMGVPVCKTEGCKKLVESSEEYCTDCLDSQADGETKS